jgi:hypothetical protein
MSLTTEQNDAEERTGEHAAVQAHDVVADAHERARAQAARVRESLVRCPGAGGSNGA